MKIIFLFSFLFFNFVDKSTSIDLGGPRKAKAVIFSNDDDVLNVIVSFIPVNCFDSATNKSLTLQKGKAYCFQALQSFLKGNKQGKRFLSISNSEILSTEYKENIFILKIQVNKKNISFMDEQRDKNQTNSTITKTNDFLNIFTSKDDFINTLEILKKTDLFLNIPKPNSNAIKFYDDISEYEEKTISILTTLTNEIKKERFLLSIEKNDLIEMLQKEERSIIAMLKKLVMEMEFLENKKNEELNKKDM